VKLLKGSAITAEDAAKNPQAVLDVLEFYTEETKREAEEYGPNNGGDDRWAALLNDGQHRPAPPRPAPPPPNRNMNDMMDELAIRTVNINIYFCYTTGLLNFYFLSL
jgi:protein-serine/threonine kinase